MLGPTAAASPTTSRWTTSRCRGKHGDTDVQVTGS